MTITPHRQAYCFTGPELSSVEAHERVVSHSDAHLTQAGNSVRWISARRRRQVTRRTGMVQRLSSP